MLQIQKIPYHGWPNCYQLSNSLIELVVTSDIGPRILRLGFPGGRNELKEFPEQAGLTGGTEWRIYGGHRFWHAPEVPPRNTQPDNDPLQVEPLPGGLRLTQAVEAQTGIRKQIEITLQEDQPHLYPRNRGHLHPRNRGHLHPQDRGRVHVLHRLTNLGLWAVELAPWALTVMAPGGTCILPLPPRGPHPQHLLPTSALALWPYTDLSDPRWSFGRRFVLLRQDAAHPNPQKIGLLSPDGWIAYVNQGHALIKRAPYQPGALYPDLGCSLEAYTDGGLLELETLGPLQRLLPGASVEHLETWSLHADIPPIQGDADVEAHLLGLI